MPVSSGVEVDGMVPHFPPGFSRLPFDSLVSVAVSGDCVSFPNEPFPDVFAVASDSSDCASELVMVFDPDVNPLAADLADQGLLHTFSVREPVAVPVFRHLVELGCIKPGEPNFLPVHANSIAVRDIGFPGERVWATR